MHAEAGDNALEQQLLGLRRLVVAQQRRIDALHAAVASDEEPSSPGLTRRGLLFASGAAAAGLALALAGDVPASAATGAMMYGAMNDATTSETELRGTGAVVLRVTKYSGSFGSAVLGTNFAGGTGVTGTGRIGVNAQADDDNTVPLRIQPRIHDGPPTANFHEVGSFYVDQNQVLYQCVVEGTPGVWRRLVPFVALPAPVRVYDSRPSEPPFIGTKAPLAPGQERTVDATLNSSGIPANATAALINLTVTDTNAAGFLGVFKDGITWPGTSNINWFGPNQILANAVTTALANAGKLRVRCGGQGSTHFVVDVMGYYP